MGGVSLKKVDILSSLLMVPVVAWVFYESAHWPVPPDMGHPAWIPRGVAVCLLLASLILFIKAISGKSLRIPERLAGNDRTRVLGVAALTAAYCLFVERTGFILATAAYMFGFALVLGERRWIRLLAFAVGVPLVTYLVFDSILNVPLPHGWFR